MAQNRTIEALDGFRLEAILHRPKTFRNIVLIGPAMGVSQLFYNNFASYLEKQNVAALTFDYRGIGRSQSEAVADLQCDAYTWAKKDLAGCIRFLSDEFPNKQLHAVCHSLSGQFLGLAREATLLDRVVTIAAAEGYWKRYPFPRNLFFALTWYGLFPLTSMTLGYFPGQTLGLGENLPEMVGRQVAGWGRSPEYIGNYSTYKQLETPILAYSFEDDSYCPKKNVDRLHDHYTSARVIRRHVRPDEIGTDHIGHFGFFHSRA
ncbi:MAG: alpha/beta fold hydrolase, partial [bacterium]